MFPCTLAYMLLFLASSTQAADVMLTSNLTSGSLAYDEQVIVFRCIAKSSILVWQSDDYIGSIADGRDLRLTLVDSPGHTERSPLVDGTVASLISVTTVNGETVIESELRIMASLATSVSSAVTCTNNGRGATNTTQFRVVSRMVTLTSNLTSENVAYDEQVIAFRCITRGAILVWQSDDYIGSVADGRDLRLTLVDPDGHTERSPTVVSTVAKIINITKDIDGPLIDSELVITASLSMRNSSVTCTNNGLERMNTTYFRVVEMLSFTTTPTTPMEIRSTATSTVDSSGGSTFTDESASDSRNDSIVGVAVGVFLVLVAVVVVITVMFITFIIFFIKRHPHKETFEIPHQVEEENGKGQPAVLPQPPSSDLIPPDLPKQPGSRVHESDPFNSERVPAAGCPAYNQEEKEDYQNLVGPPVPREPREEFTLIQANMDVGSPQESPDRGSDGDYGEIEKSSSSLGTEESHGDAESVGLHEAVGHDNKPLEAQEDQALVPVTETGIGKAMLVHSCVWSPPHGVVHTSLPNKCATGIPMEPSDTEDRASYSLPLKMKEVGTTDADNIIVNLSKFAPLQLGSTSCSVDQYETDTGAESDPEIYPSSSTPLTSLRPDLNGGRFMVSGSVSYQLDSETSSRATMSPQRQIVIAESDKQITETEEIIIEAGVDMQPNNDEMPESVLQYVKVV